MKLTELLGIYGAVLSSAVFIWNAERARPKVRVRLTVAVDSFEGKTCGGLGISVQNPSAHAVHIMNVGLMYPFRSVTLLQRIKHLLQFKRLPLRLGWCHSSLSNHGVDDGCPVTIEPGKSHWIFFPHDVLHGVSAASTSQRLIVQVQDALWRNKYSNELAYALPPKELLREQQSQLE